MDLTNLSELKPFLLTHGFSPNKGLGQHFLHSRPVVTAIVAATKGAASAVEIGPGPGVLTSALCEAISVVHAVELDERAVSALMESAPLATIHVADALSFDFEKLLQSLPAPRVIVSNLPYYITAALLTVIGKQTHHLQGAVLMMQKEVGERVTAPVGNSNRGSLSVHMQSLFEIKRVVQVPPGSFLPPPKVESVVLKFTSKPQVFPEELFDWIRTGFTQPRKTLANNLRASGRFQVESVGKAILSLGLDERIRPQFLTTEQWSQLYGTLLAAQD